MVNDIALRIGENIKLYRNKAQLTQEQLADSIKVKRSVISKYENGSIEPSLSQLNRIADVLKIPLSMLYSDPSFEDILEQETRNIYLEAIGEKMLKLNGAGQQLLADMSIALADELLKQPSYARSPEGSHK